MQCRLNTQAGRQNRNQKPTLAAVPSAVAKVTLNKSLYRTSIVAIDNLVKIHLVSYYSVTDDCGDFLRRGGSVYAPIPLKPQVYEEDCRIALDSPGAEDQRANMAVICHGRSRGPRQERFDNGTGIFYRP